LIPRAPLRCAVVQPDERPQGNRSRGYDEERKVDGIILNIEEKKGGDVSFAGENHAKMKRLNG